MNPPKNLLEACEGYFSYINAHYPAKRAESLTQEVWCMLRDGIVMGLGYSKSPEGPRTRSAERQAIKAFMADQPTHVLLEARIALQRGFERISRTEGSKYNLIRTLERFLDWCIEQSWWMGEIVHPDAMADLCSPSLVSTHKNRNQYQTHRRESYTRYTLSNEDICPSLTAELDALYAFLTAPECPGRVIPPVSPDTARKNYIKDLLLILGWFCYEQHVPPDQLSFNLLIPKLEKASLTGLSQNHKRQAWREAAAKTEDWIQRYFDFLRESMAAISPRTNRSKLAALSALAKFQYRLEVDAASDYREIPVLKVILKLLQDNGNEVCQWNNSHRYVADQEMKWPNTVPGKTALATVQSEILEVLRLKARPKSEQNKVRGGSAMALSQQRYIAWYLFAGLPPRRQEEYRELKIALACPIQRPQSVPPEGCYHPLPPKEVREQRYDGLIQDNYLYKSYTYRGKYYKDGVWLLDIHDHKMRNLYGPQTIKIKNRLLGDGSHLYEYFEYYLYGCWLPGGRKQQHIYDWWQQDLRGRRGRWVGAGRGSLGTSGVHQSSNSSQDDVWYWGYFFIQPRAGTQYSGQRFAEMIENAAHHCIGKRINPHHMRVIWATWAHQVGLSDRQKESLAYAMGHDVRTLEALYNRASPAEKRRPIEEHVRKEFLADIQPKTTPQPTEAQLLEKKLKHLSRTQRKQLAAILRQKRTGGSPITNQN